MPEKLKSALSELAEEVGKHLSLADSADKIEQLRVQYLGRKGRLTTLMKQMGDLPAEARPMVGQVANKVKNQLTAAIKDRIEELKSGPADSGSGLDVTLPGRRKPRGKGHLITRTIEEITTIFTRMGFNVAEGPEVETDYYCFEALNFPKDHPARDMQDTLFVSDDVVLRTHTSPMQVRTMEKQKPPVWVVVPGKTYRRDSDVTHTPMFHQIEGLVVDVGITFGDLVGTLEAFVHQFFSPDTPVRLRPSFFPFTEPSAEVDIGCVICKGRGCRVCGHTGWLEILGSGMVDPEVFRYVGYDPEEVSGFAFGMGMERVAMLKHGIDDLRLFFENDLRFLKQF
jgi:phenylalanyl-tRNA synthetase alpha chain